MTLMKVQLILHYDKMYFSQDFFIKNKGRRCQWRQRQKSNHREERRRNNNMIQSAAGLQVKKKSPKPNSTIFNEKLQILATKLP